MSEPRWINFDKVSASFVDEAPDRFAVTVDTPLAQQAVWNAFANAKTWPHWFPKVTDAFYTNTDVLGIGTVRHSVVDSIHYEETMLIWDEPHRWGYRIDRATMAISSAQLELTEFEKTATGTRVRWVLACKLLHPIDKPSFETFLAKLLREALERLAIYVRDHQSSPEAD